MDKLIVTLLGITTVGGIYWFFFGKKEEATMAENSLTITVDGGYKPNLIKINKNQAIKLTFIRKDNNSCLEELVFPDYKIKEYLPMNTPVTITLPPPHRGKSGWHCGMNMFHGRLEIVT